jgi:hypothetical protein
VELERTEVRKGEENLYNGRKIFETIQTQIGQRRERDRGHVDAFGHVYDIQQLQVQKYGIDPRKKYTVITKVEKEVIIERSHSVKWAILH